jgi:putative transposase
MSTPAHRTVPGTSYFVTTKCGQGRSLFQVTEVAEILLNTLFHYRDSGAYLLHEFVIMPDHLHLMLTPNSETSLEKTVQLIKGGSSHRIHKARGGKMEVWQVGFHDWTMRDLDDWKAKANYIYMNPVKALLCERPEDWPYSSANQRFSLDCMPKKYQNLASGAKAPIHGAFTQGLKPLPPKEPEKTAERSSFAVKSSDVGPKGPTPGASTSVSASGRYAVEPVPQGLKPIAAGSADVGPEGPTPVAPTSGSGSGRYAVDPIPQGLKPIVAGSADVGPKGPTPGATTKNPDTAKAYSKRQNS